MEAHPELGDAEKEEEEEVSPGLKAAKPRHRAMSQVIQNHVLRVGQTVHIPSREDSKRLHAAGYAGCSALPTSYCYYSTGAWADPKVVGCPKGRLVPGGGLYGAHSALEHSAGAQGQQEASLEQAGVPHQPQQQQQGDAGTEPDAHLSSPTLDISIESLNKLILEIDPTFQPLTCKPVKDTAQPASQGDVTATKKHDPEVIGEARGDAGAAGPSGLRPCESCSREVRGKGWPQGMVMSPCPQRDRCCVGVLRPGIRAWCQGGQAGYPASV